MDIIENLDTVQLEDLARIVQDLRGDLLCCSIGNSLKGESEQNYLLALSYLDLAQRHLTLAALQAKPKNEEDEKHA